jgi:hypothetical protein
VLRWRKVLSWSRRFCLLGVGWGVDVEGGGEKKKFFSEEIIISSQCSEWLASTLEILLGHPEDQDFIKSFRDRLKILIARRGGNQASRFLEATEDGWPERVYCDP